PRAELRPAGAGRPGRRAELRSRGGAGGRRLLVRGAARVRGAHGGPAEPPLVDPAGQDRPEARPVRPSPGPARDGRAARLPAAAGPPSDPDREQPDEQPGHGCAELRWYRAVGGDAEPPGRRPGAAGRLRAEPAAGLRVAEPTAGRAYPAGERPGDRRLPGTGGADPRTRSAPGGPDLPAGLPGGLPARGPGVAGFRPQRPGGRDGSRTGADRDP